MVSSKQQAWVGILAGVLLLIQPISGLQHSGSTPGHRTLHRERPAIQDPIEALLWRGIDAMYSYRFHEAAATLDSVMDLDPDNSVAPFVAVANQWLLSSTEQGYKASHDALLEAINATIPRYEDMLSRNGHRAEILLFLGSTYGLRARVHLADKNWLAVLYSGLKGWRLVYNAHKMDTSLTDAYLPIGIFDYYAGRSSPPIQLVARMFGIHPDRQAGIRTLEQAVQRAPYAWIEAANTIATACLYSEGDTDKAYLYTQLLLQHYPDNYDFNFLLGEELVRSRRLQEAWEFMPKLRTLFVKSHPNQRLEWELKYAYLEAALAFEEGDYVRALDRCSWVIDNYDMEFDWHLGFAHLIRGRIREQNGDYQGARADYRIVTDLDNKTYAVEEAEAALARLESTLARH